MDFRNICRSACMNVLSGLWRWMMAQVIIAEVVWSFSIDSVNESKAIPDVIYPQGLFRWIRKIDLRVVESKFKSGLRSLQVSSAIDYASRTSTPTPDSMLSWRIVSSRLIVCSRSASINLFAATSKSACSTRVQCSSVEWISFRSVSLLDLPERVATNASNLLAVHIQSELEWSSGWGSNTGLVALLLC